MVSIADFHIHSKFSLAASPLMVPEFIAKAAVIKGIELVGTGDFLHPEYLKILNRELKEDGYGLYRLKNSKNKVSFIPTVEVSNVFKAHGKTRKIHMLIFSPSLRDCGLLSGYLGKVGKISSDGRPTFTFHVKDLVKRVLDCSPDSFLVPAHAWTPWFSLFGSFSGFDSIEECFEEESENIFSIETGLSSDPPMNLGISSLDRITLMSNSDAHSPSKLGREANVFSRTPAFGELKAILKKEERGGLFLYTIEFYPQEGKYFADGHRKCSFSFIPEEVENYNFRCPSCGGKITEGVLHRIKKLSDRKGSNKPSHLIPSKHVIPLAEIIAFTLNKRTSSKAVKKSYDNLIGSVGSEFYVLLEADKDELEKSTTIDIAEAVIAAREGNVEIAPGYDGVYGMIKIIKN